MIAPPLVLRLSVESPERRRVRLWLPLFLVWLLLLPLGLLALALAAIADAVLLLAGERYHHCTILLFRCLQVLAETRGTVVRVRGERTTVEMTIA